MKVIRREILGETLDTRIIRLDVLSPDIAREAKPGQFIALMVKEEGERIPLTIVDRDQVKGTITLIFQEAGLTTRLLGGLNKDDLLYSVAGPLGHPTEINNFGKVILVGGGVGIAELYPVAKAMKEAGNYIVTILGARTKDLLLLENELKTVSDQLHITTDDGSYERKGFTTCVLAELLKKDKFALAYAVGPIPMMRRVCAVTKDFNLKTIVSLNALMVDATGMCGCCRVEVDGKTQFSCVDGPEFEGHKVDWDGLVKRNSVYLEQEKHSCNLYK